MASFITDVTRIKKTLVTTALVAALATVSIGCSSSKSTKEVAETMRSPQDKPNVVLIYLDDAGHTDIGVNGGKYPTPNIDRMAAEGVNLESFYAPASVSTPSRAGLLTGRLAARTGIWGNQVSIFFEDSANGLPQDETTVAEMMKDNGYSTLMLGKWHLGIGDENQYMPTRQGFDEWWGIPASNDMYLANDSLQASEMLIAFMSGDMGGAMKINMARQGIIGGKANKGWGSEADFAIPQYHAFANNVNGVTTYDDSIIGTMDQTNFTRNIGERATSYIEQHKNEPFFIYIPTVQNHVPIFASEEFRGKTDTPYGDVVTEQDYLVGQILQQLQDSGIENNTIVILASDNGPDIPYQTLGLAGSAEPLRAGKHSPFEGGFRTFGVIQWKGQIQPASTDAIFSGYDVLPTIAGLANITPPNVTLDGFDMSPLLLNQEPSPRKVFPYYIGANLAAFRSGDWKVVYYDFKSPIEGYIKLDTPQLYSMAGDATEGIDMAKEKPEIFAQIMAEANNYNTNIGSWRPSVTDELFMRYAKIGAERRNN